MVVEVVLTAALVAVHALVAAVVTRYFRIRMRTRWGSALYTLTFVPLLLLGTTLLVSGVLGVGVDLGHPAVVVAVLVGLPLVFGVTVDVLYVDPPEEYDLPATEG